MCLLGDGLQHKGEECPNTEPPGRLRGCRVSAPREAVPLYLVTLLLGVQSWVPSRHTVALSPWPINCTGDAPDTQKVGQPLLQGDCDLRMPVASNLTLPLVYERATALTANQSEMGTWTWGFCRECLGCCTGGDPCHTIHLLDPNAFW